MFDKTCLINDNCFIFLVKLKAIDTRQSIDKIGKRDGDSSIFCSYHLLLILRKHGHEKDVYLGKTPVYFQIELVRNVANAQLVLASDPS